MSAPESFGPFQVIGELASGAQGVVLDARRGEQRVALKLLRTAAPRQVLRFKQEARVLEQLRHPNLPRVIDHGELNGLPYLGLELIEGEDLAAAIESRGVPPLDWAARVLASVASALEHCHRRGVLHRDVKPANVVIERGTGRPVLVDFGLIKADTSQVALGSIEEAADHLSRTGEIRGTPAYMAPEQITAERYGPLSPRTDVYALGGTLYTLLTGEAPVEGGGIHQVIASVLQGDPPDPRDLRPDVPRPLADLCRRALSRDPRQRPESAAAFAAQLLSALGEAPEPTGASGPASASDSGELRIGGYPVRRELGRGAMGVVFEVEAEGERRALKVLLDGSPSHRERFRRGVKLLESLSRHPAIATVYRWGEHRGQPFLVRELTPTTLAERIVAGERELCLDALVAVARAVHFAHEAGVLHRNLKPENVLVRADGSPLLADLGLARDERDDAALTRTGEFLGTVGTMAPEQLQGKATDRRSDVYSLGVLLYLCLTRGVLPFQGSIGQLVDRILTGDVTPPSAHADVPAALDALCLRCLQADPGRRPPTAEDFARELEAARAGRTLAPLGGGGGGRRLRRQALVLAGAAAGATALAAVLWVRHDPTAPRRPVAAEAEEVRPEPVTPAPVEVSPEPTPAEAAALSAPAWYRAIAPDRRPALPLPEGVSFGEAPGEYVNAADGSRLVWVPPAAFRMGFEALRSTRPEHLVLISRGYFLGKLEVTWAQYLAFCLRTGRAVPAERETTYHGDRLVALPEHPVYDVSWHDAVAYCEWAGLRLPTEAEWELAARASTSHLYPWGGSVREALRHGNYGGYTGTASERGRDARESADGYGWLAPVGSFPSGASPCGALDMTGNVGEWVACGHVDYGEAPRVDPHVPGGRPVFRGMSWVSHPSTAHGAWRKWGGPGYHGRTVGFRVARSHPGDPGAAYPAEPVARAEAYLADHPHDALARQLVEQLRAQ